MIYKTFTTGAAIALVASTLSFSAVAAEDYSIFENVDANGDGFISKNEAKVRKDLNKDWKTVDTDKNGKVDISEFSAFEGTGFTPPTDPDMGELGAAPYPDPSK